MLGDARLQQVHEFVSKFTKEELIWINGYLTGLLQNGTIANSNNGASQNNSVKKITIAYGTETGNAKKLSNSFAASAKKIGIAPKIVALDQYRLTDLAKEEYLFVIVSTHGEGEPPTAAEKFYNYIHEQSLTLNQLKFGVLALGDSSYPLFCKTGEDVDNRLASLGANRVVDLKKCDVDYEIPASEWFDNIIKTLNKTANGTNGNVITKTSATPPPSKKEGKKSYEGKLITHINLNDTGSSKETFHIEIATEEQPEYEPGDSAGIYPHNKKELVDAIIKITGIDENKEIAATKTTATVRTLLTRHLNVSYLLRTTIQKYAAIVQVTIPDTRMDLKDLLKIYPVKDAEQFESVIKILNPISPRLYTISSSPAAHNNEVHLTVAKNKFTINGEQHVGVCSEFLSDLNEGNTIRFYIHKNRSFKLPAPDKDIIMIGPGTGIAPFRSFVAERDVTGATGKSWLFFGDRNFTTDFSYQTEWQQYLSTGALTKINLAWSRDGNEKYYIQQELKKEAELLMEWMNNGAHLYLCGNKDNMAVDVEKALTEIIANYHKISTEEATKLLKQWGEDGRYEKDVY